jgi:hypothetical protein
MTILNVTITGENNKVDNMPAVGIFPEGTQVNVTNPCTGDTVTGIFTTQKDCPDCVFYSYKHCPYVPNHGCIASALGGDKGRCAVLPVEDMI